MDIYLEKLKIKNMYSGDLCIELTEKIEWENFPVFAKYSIEFLGGQLIEEATVVDMHLWEIQIGTENFNLVYEDFPQMCSLEARDAAGSVQIKGIYEKLKYLRNL